MPLTEKPIFPLLDAFPDCIKTERAQVQPMTMVTSQMLSQLHAHRGGRSSSPTRCCCPEALNTVILALAIDLVYFTELTENYKNEVFPVPL